MLAELDDRLSDEVSRIVLALRRELSALLRARLMAHEHSVSAGLVCALDDKLVEIVEHVSSIRRAITNVRWHIRKNRFLREVELDHVRHERIDGLVVGDARS